MIITTRGFKKPANIEPYDVKDSNDNVDKLEEILDAVDLEMDQLFQSVSDGKTLVAGAITDKGVNTSPTSTFQQMANNIDAIETDPSIGTTNAAAADVLAPKKVVSQGNLLTGTMPNRGAVNQNLTTEGQEYTIPQGHHSGLGKIKAVITGLVASVVKAGTTVGGILGTFTSDATATAAQMLAGITAYVNGNKITGTMPNNGAQSATLTTQGASKVIPAGYTTGGTITASFANLSVGNVKSGVNIGGVVGTLMEFPTTGISGSTLNSNDFGWVGKEEMYAPTVSTSKFLCAFRTAQAGSGYQITVTIPAGAIVYFLNFTTGVFELVTGTKLLPGVRFATYIFLNPGRVTLTGNASNYVFSGYFIA